MRPKPIVLIVMDGWGVAPSDKGNAVIQARTPNLDSYFSFFPSLSLQAGGISVGLPWGDVGNSEVGHTTIGAGTILYQNSPRISIDIENGKFFDNKELVACADHVKKNKSKLHLLGLVSPGGVHSSFDHLLALLDFAKKQRVKEVYIHAIMDGRDADPNGGLDYISELTKQMKEKKVGQIASLVGRFYAMDRNNTWDRVEKAYNSIVRGIGKTATDPIDAINQSYSKNVLDEQFDPTVITDKGGKAIAPIEENDGLIFFNFRADRARELTKAISLPGFEKFDRPDYVRNLYFVTMTEYEEALPVAVAYPPMKAKAPLAKILSERGFRQLHVAETEKYAHVTYFFNGGEEQPFLNEDRILVPSKPIKSYDQDPGMSAYEITEQSFNAIKRGFYDFVVINYANPDMVGHTGNFDAAVEGLETLDGQIARLVDLTTSVGGAVFITADHGNCEQMTDYESGEIEKEHTANPVPFIMISAFNGLSEPLNLDAVRKQLESPEGLLADVAPTILDLMTIQKPADMTGESLLPNLMPAKGNSVVIPK